MKPFKEMQGKYPNDINVRVAQISLENANPSFPRIFEEEPTILSEDDRTPGRYELSQNYPNPFNPVTSIEYTLVNKAHVSLKIYNILGQEVLVLVYGEKEAGHYVVSWDASDMASGIYFYRLVAGEFTDTKRMVLIK